MSSILLLLLALPQEGLRVEGPKLLDKGGREVLLRGVSLANVDAMGAELRRERIETLAKSWHANCIRIPILPGSWKQKGAAHFDPILDETLAACRDLGVYAILDYHAIGNPATGKTMKDKAEFDASPDLARAFWKHMAARHKDKPGVLFEIWNEPMAVTWTDLKPFLATLVALVREQAPETPIIVPSPDSTYDLRASAADPVPGKNLLFGWHVYAVRGTSSDAYIGEALKKAPVIATEWGYSPKGDFTTTGTSEAFGLPLLRMMEERRMHWTASAWHPQANPPLLTGWDGGVTAFGWLARAWLAGDRPVNRPALKEVNDFAVWLRKVDLKALGDSKFDLCVIDPESWTPDQLDPLKWSIGGPKIVLAYLSIAEAEPRRPYWQKGWTPGNPEWLGQEVRSGRFQARYWEEKWHKVLLDAVDGLVAQGFDGLFLDGVAEHAAWRQKEKDDRMKPRMMELVSKISSQGKRRNKGFLIMVRNGDDLLEGAPFMNSIDGLVREELYFVKDRALRGAEVQKSEDLLDKAVKAGKKIFVLEYAKEQASIDWIYDRCRAHGYTAWTGPRELDALPVSTGHEPD